MQLEDNRHYFPPYDAAPVARAQTLLKYPHVRAALQRLGGRVTADDMRRMNYAVDALHTDAAQVVREFLCCGTMSFCREDRCRCEALTVSARERRCPRAPAPSPSTV